MSDLSTAILTIVVAAVPPTIAGIAAARKAARAAAKSEENGAKADQIHILVNSKMSQALADLAGAKAEIKALQEQIAAGK